MVCVRVRSSMAMATKLVMTRKSPGVTDPLPSMQKVHTVFSRQQADMRRMTASNSKLHRLCSWCSATLSVSCFALHGQIVVLQYKGCPDA